MSTEISVSNSCVFRTYFFQYIEHSLAHKQNRLSNNSLITESDIGVDDDAVYCVVVDTNCCGTLSTGNGRGQWYFPNGNQLQSSTANSNLWYSTWTTGAVLLNYRKTSTTGTTGIFYCEIQDSQSELHALYIGIYAANEGTQSHN